MSEENQGQENAATTPPTPPPAETNNKQTYRRKVWEHLDKNNLVIFPRPAFGRIPNFKGSAEAAAKLLELEEFKAAKNIEVNPDKPQEAARVLVLEQGKQLYVPVPRLKEGLLKHITVQENANKNQIREAISRRGLEFDGRIISVDDALQLDLLVLGSVAVSKEGYRIGKGKGYADLEFAVLLEMKAVGEETVVVTVVHDCQVFDTLPSELFQPHDVPVDYILTPTQIIKTTNRLPRPPGIIWNILSNRRITLMPVLQALKAKHESAGKDVTLKDTDTDVETYDTRRPRPKFRRAQQQRLRSRRRRTVSEGGGAESQTDNNGGDNNRERQARRYTRTRRFFRTRRTPQSETRANENGNTTGDENNQQSAREPRRLSKPRRPFRPYRRNRLHIDFSLMVSNIEKTVRVRDLKKVLNEHGVKPNDITWHGYKGFCYLHYAKPNNNRSVETEEPQQSPIVVDNVIEILQNLKISPDSERNLDVKVMGTVSRIETTDVTAV